LQFVYKDKFKTKSSIDYKYLKSHYSRILKECQAQRNSIIHSSLGNEKSLMLIDLTIPKLVTRFRWILFDGMRKYKNSNFEELIGKLKLDANKLLNKK